MWDWVSLGLRFGIGCVGFGNWVCQVFGIEFWDWVGWFWELSVTGLGLRCGLGGLVLVIGCVKFGIGLWDWVGWFWGLGVSGLGIGCVGFGDWVCQVWGLRCGIGCVRFGD